MYDFLLPFYCVLNEECDADIKIANNERYLHTHTHTRNYQKMYTRMYVLPKNILLRKNWLQILHWLSIFLIPVGKNKRNFIRIEFPEITQNFQKFILLNKYIATIDNYIKIT